MPDYSRYLKHIDKLSSANQVRSLKDIGTNAGAFVNYQNQQMINFSSNDYLGLAFDKNLHNEFYAHLSDENLLDKYGLGSSSSRLLTGNFSSYCDLELLLTKLFQRPAALVFNSGYHANIGIIPALTTKKDLILSDKLNHASMIDGLKLSSATVIRYRHFDYEQLEDLLVQKRDQYDQVFIMSESIFSMDGDLVDLKKLVELKEKYNCFLYLDEAHAIGTRGENGLGLAEEMGLIEKVDLLVGTFGKAIASQGAYLICNEIIKDYLVNTMRSLIFTTALPPITIAWLEFILQKVPKMKDSRNKLMELSSYLQGEVISLDLAANSSSNIIPIMLGENHKAEQMSLYLKENKILAFPIRPPTVPQNTARLRLSLTANMEISQLETLVELIKEKM